MISWMSYEPGGRCASFSPVALLPLSTTRTHRESRSVVESPCYRRERDKRRKTTKNPQKSVEILLQLTQVGVSQVLGGGDDSRWWLTPHIPSDIAIERCGGESLSCAKCRVVWERVCTHIEKATTAFAICSLSTYIWAPIVLRGMNRGNVASRIVG